MTQQTIQLGDLLAWSRQRGSDEEPAFRVEADVDQGDLLTIGIVSLATGETFRTVQICADPDAGVHVLVHTGRNPKEVGRVDG